MLQYNEDIDIRSEEVQEILGTPPGWLTQWGTTVAFLAFLVLIWLSYWIKYPEVVHAEIKVTSTEPPRKLYAENTGTITRVLVRNEQVVDSGAALLAFRSTANVDDVMTFETMLDQVEILNDSSLLAFDPPTNLLLGDIQNTIYDFIKKQEEYRRAVSNRSGRVNIRERERQIAQLEQEIKNNSREQQRLQDQIEALSNQVARQQKLYQERKITLRQLRETQEQLRMLERERQGVISDSKSKQFDIQMIRNEIRGVRADSRMSSSDALSALSASFMAMQDAVEAWKKQYLVVAPIKGMVGFTNQTVNITEQQYVPRETELLTIVPTGFTQTIGSMLLDLDGSGRVDTGQQVVVKFNSYPFYEYGAVIGRVKWKGKVPSDGKISVQIDFPNGLVTTRGKSIEPTQEMSGTADIITSDKRLIEKFFEGFRRLSG